MDGGWWWGSTVREKTTSFHVVTQRRIKKRKSRSKVVIGHMNGEPAVVGDGGGSKRDNDPFSRRDAMSKLRKGSQDQRSLLDV